MKVGSTLPMKVQEIAEITFLDDAHVRSQ